MFVHVQVLVRIAGGERMLGSNAAICLLVMNVQANAVVGRAQALSIAHIHQALQGHGTHVWANQSARVSVQAQEAALI